MYISNKILIMYQIFLAIKASICMQEQFRLQVNKLYCQNKSVSISYKVPKKYGDRAYFLIQEDNNRDMGYSEYFRSQPPRGQFIFQAQNATSRYTIIMYGSKISDHRYATALDWKHCPGNNNDVHTKTKSDSKGLRHGVRTKTFTENLVWVLIALIIYVLLLIFRVFAYWYFLPLKKDKNMKISSSRSNEIQSQNEIFLNIEQCNNTNAEFVAKRENTHEKQGTIYIISTDEHEKHMEILNIFASYLQEDLGFIVKIHLWEQLETYEAREQWMFKRMKEADKILVIWSPGAKDLWEKCNAYNFSKNYDMFTPIVKQIEKDFICHKNAQKYYFAYFKYCSKSDIPLELLELVSCTYSLMDDAEKLYFMLGNQENYVPGRKVHEDKAPSNLFAATTKNGKRLKDSLATMSLFCNKNREWYKRASLSQVIKRHSVTINDSTSHTHKMFKSNKDVVIGTFSHAFYPPTDDQFLTTTENKLTIQDVVPIDMEINPVDKIADINNLPTNLM
ncbi:uncharacterized protein LOC143450771 isoform X1 [Clavelina lepadiformis]|uniref:uncharacterized protein LOC143450771 isoform X1 n=1 Tax=Clavelina lepadiformis TaxID=159417 RepID=UPI0040410563